MKNRILAIGAHPDDIELGCGGVIAKHLESGDEVFALILTNGERGSHTLDRSECHTALEFLGIKKDNIFFGSLPDGYLTDDQRTVSLIESYINSLKINRVYTHYPVDRHQDHRNCSRAVSAAARKIPEIFLFQGPSTSVPFEPHYFIEISGKHLDKKISALEKYDTQVSKGIVNLRSIKSLAEHHGSCQNTEYAEAFAVNHVLRKDNDL